MKRTATLAGVALAMLVATPDANTAHASWWVKQHPVELKVLEPTFSRWAPVTNRSSGWPITLELTMNGELGIASYTGEPPFPGYLETGYVVFDDPDNCLEFFPSPIVPPGGCTPDAVPDETYVEFTADIDQPGVIDFAGNDVLRMDQVDSLDGVVEFNTVLGDGTSATRRLGPVTGAEIVDGYGVGTPDDDLPGLVVLSPHGIGLVLDADFNPPAVRTQRNLAGLVSSVSYTLNDFTKRTTVTAHMNVPDGAIAPFVKIDGCVGDPALCEQPALWRIDGGPLQSASAGGVLFEDLYAELHDSLTYELRIFVVSGIGPATLADQDGNGVVNHHDATLAGYNVLSRERKVKVRLIRGDRCFNPSQGVFEDFDGNGHTELGVVCPAGSGGVRKVPR